MASVGAVSKTLDEILATLHLYQSTDDLKLAYNEFLKNLTVSCTRFKFLKTVFITNRVHHLNFEHSKKCTYC